MLYFGLQVLNCLSFPHILVMWQRNRRYVKIQLYLILSMSLYIFHLFQNISKNYVVGHSFVLYTSTFFVVASIFILSLICF